MSAPQELVIERNTEVGADRRSQTRYKVALAVTQRGMHNFYLGLSENMSEGGLFIATYSQLQIGAIVDIEFTLPTLERPIRVQGAVRWTRSADSCHAEHNNYASGAEDGLHPGYGLQFVDLLPEDEAAIRQFIRIRQPDFYDC